MTLRRILVASDMSELSRAALEAACELCRATGADLHIVNAFGLSSSDHPYTALMSPDIERQVIETSRMEFERWAGRFVPQGLEAETHSSPMEPRSGILAVAEQIDADLIVMGTHGRSGLKHLLLGSVAELVVRSAPCPVMTVGQLPK